MPSIGTRSGYGEEVSLGSPTSVDYTINELHALLGCAGEALDRVLNKTAPVRKTNPQPCAPGNDLKDCNTMIRCEVATRIDEASSRLRDLTTALHRIADEIDI